MSKYIRVICSLLSLAFISPIAGAGNICDSAINYDLEEVNQTNGGIGGTGHGQGGIGGTGHTNPPGGIGGTGHSAPTGGIGGTGHNLEGGGIGGTGWKVSVQSGNTQILGVITGFASVCVNGVEVQYDQNTLVESDGQTGGLQSLQVGQLVSVSATGRGQEVSAQKISILHALSGPVTKVDSAQGIVHVMGQMIDISNAVQARSPIKIGDNLRVSGLAKPNGIVQATRIEKAPANAQSFINKALLPDNNALGIKVQGVHNLTTNTVRIKGDWNGSALVAKQIETITQPKLVAGTAVHIQGYGYANSDATLNLQGLSISTSSTAYRQRDLSRPLIVHGVVDAHGQVQPESIELLDSKRLLDRGGKSSMDKSGTKNESGNSGKTEESSSDDNNQKSSEKLQKLQTDYQKELTESTEKALEEAEKASEKAREEAEKLQEKAKEEAEKSQENAAKALMDAQDKAQKAKDDASKAQLKQSEKNTLQSPSVNNSLKVEKIDKVQKADKI